MPSITVKIEKDEQGQFTVGVDTADQDGSGNSVEGLMQPEGGDMQAMPANQHTMPGGQMMSEGAEDSGMNPATDLEDALNQARSLLAGPATEQQAFAAA